jgi:hypothetical protein
MRLQMAVILSGLILWAGCATTRQYEENLRTWEGKDSAALIKKWGPPTKTLTLADGGKMFQYLKKNQEHIIIKRENASSPNAVEPLFDCKTTFIISQSDAIVAWRYEGHACRK